MANTQMDTPHKHWNLREGEDDVESIELVGRGAYGDVFKVYPDFF